MSEDAICPECGDNFDNESAMKQHRRAKHDTTEESTFDFSGSLKKWGRYGIYGLGVFALGYVLLFWINPGSNTQKYPSQRDHWHARYSIEICGEEIPRRPYSQGDVHTHGKGQIHIHPHSSATSGKSANLSAFFESFDGTLTNQKLAVPRVGTYENGDDCNGEPGEVVVRVNGSKVSNPSGYVPQDGDVVKFSFEAQ